MLCPCVQQCSLRILLELVACFKSYTNLVSSACTLYAQRCAPNSTGPARPIVESLARPMSACMHCNTLSVSPLVCPLGNSQITGSVMPQMDHGLASLNCSSDGFGPPRPRALTTSRTPSDQVPCLTPCTLVYTVSLYSSFAKAPQTIYQHIDHALYCETIVESAANTSSLPSTAAWMHATSHCATCSGHKHDWGSMKQGSYADWDKDTPASTGMQVPSITAVLKAHARPMRLCGIAGLL